MVLLPRSAARLPYAAGQPRARRPASIRRTYRMSDRREKEDLLHKIILYITQARGRDAQHHMLVDEPATRDDTESSREP